jgi:Uma2 family endonuclease
VPARSHSATKLSLPGEDREIAVPSSALDHAGFRAWVTSPEFPDGLRATFVDREVLLDMSPEALDTHNQVKRAVTRAIDNIVIAEELGELYVDGMLITNRAAALSTEPDLAFATWETLELGRLRRVPRAKKADCVELEGTPDLVVEIVSDTSVRKDTVLLRDAYAKAGVQEYWLIDARGATLSFEILALAGRGGHPTRTRPKRSQLSAVLGRRFSLRRKRSRSGGWAYDLVEVPRVLGR